MSTDAYAHSALMPPTLISCPLISPQDVCPTLSPYISLNLQRYCNRCQQNGFPFHERCVGDVPKRSFQMHISW